MLDPLRSLALAVLAVLLPEGLRPEAMPQPTITISPMPPHQGETITITHTGPYPVTLLLDWDPAAEPSKITITGSGGTQVGVPDGASSLVVTDPTPGGANYVSTVVLP